MFTSALMVIAVSFEVALQLYLAYAMQPHLYVLGMVPMSMLLWPAWLGQELSGIIICLKKREACAVVVKFGSAGMSQTSSSANDAFAGVYAKRLVMRSRVALPREGGHCYLHWVKSELTTITFGLRCDASLVSCKRTRPVVSSGDH
jgi:hypothetical protein